jgi:hypothetical protein
MSRGGGRGRGGYFHGDRGRGGGFNGRGGGYDDWGKRPGDDLDGPPSRMRKMDTHSPDLLEENGRRPGDSNGASAAKTITDLAKRIDKVPLPVPDIWKL